MDQLKLDAEEADVLNSYENEEWQPIPQLEAEKQRYQEYARATFKKDSRVNIRISSKDLEAIQKKALEEGIPYQTLIAGAAEPRGGGRLMYPSSCDVCSEMIRFVTCKEAHAKTLP